MRLCLAEVKVRFALNMPKWNIKVVDKDGTRLLPTPAF